MQLVGVLLTNLRKQKTHRLKEKVVSFSICSPEGIRTLVADLRSQSPRPLDDGALVHFFTAGYCAGVPGLEPRLTEPESAGLPITPYPNI